MTIASIDDYIASAKQLVDIVKTGSMTSVAANYQDVIALAGQPGAGTLAGTNTANGVVPTDLTAGFPVISPFGSGATGYLSRVIFNSSVSCRLRICDCLFKAGAYAYNANTTLTSQPSYESRIPVVNGSPDYKGTEIWLEAVTAFTGNITCNVTYTDQYGNAGASAGAAAYGIAPIAGRMIRVPFATGDDGVQKIESVVATVATAGTFNVLVLRPIWEGRVIVAGAGDLHDFLRTGLPVVFDDSALLLQVSPDSTSTGYPSLLCEIANL